METPLISIVLPVYNAQRFLRSCLKSVLKQKYQNWELIAVNDGSLDNSLEILEEFAKRDIRIRIINKNNEGVSIARNTALKQVKGEWVYFMDADDILYPDALASLISIALQNDATFVKADFKAIDEMDDEIFANKKFFIRRKFGNTIMNAELFVRKVVMDEYFLWTCLFRRDIICNHNIQFLPNCRMMEDADFMVTYLLHSNHNIYLHSQIYGYRKHQTAATGSENDYTEDLKMIVAHLSQYKKSFYIKALLASIDESLWLMNNKSGIMAKYIRIRQMIKKMNIFISYKIAKKWQKIKKI